MKKLTYKTPFVKQHITPVFLLKRWCNDQGKLCRFKYVNNRLEVRWKSPISVAYKNELLNFHSRADLPKHFMESNIFGPIYDNDGGNVLETLLQSGVTALKLEQEESWSRFIAS